MHSAALLERWPHEITFTVLPTNRFISTTKSSMKCVVNWVPLRICVRRGIPNPTSWWGWVFLEQTRILSGFQFTKNFIEIFVVETKRFVSSFLNVILTRQTCGQRSSRAAESKHRALGDYFSERICYMFLVSECRGGSPPPHNQIHSRF